MSDPISDMLTRLRNASQVKKEKVDIPSSKLKLEIARILKDNGYIADFRRIEDRKQGVLRAFLKYTQKGAPIFTGFKRLSKPSSKIYTKYKRIPLEWSKEGITIISTSQGVMTGQQAREKHFGGEILCYIR